MLPNVTVEDERYPVPLIATTCEVPPAVAELGERFDMVGTGLGGALGAFTAKLAVLVTPARRAEIVTFWFVFTAEVVIVNAALLCPLDTFTSPVT
jgi:hypothetical protein